jgi:RNA polymerase sigma factor (sigma-70 family)
LQSFEEISRDFAGAIARLAGSYERDPDLQKDLQQEILINLWRSLPHFKGGCSIRSWVFRIGHNTAASYILKQVRSRRALWVGLDDVVLPPATEDTFELVAGGQARIVLIEAIRSLRLPDRQVIALYAEGLPAHEISEITGLTPANVGKKIERFKVWLATSKGVLKHEHYQGSAPSHLAG